MKILVTGGAGFIGAHLVKALYTLRHEVVVVDNLNDFYDVQLKNDRLEKLLNKDKYVLEKVDICDLENLEKIFEKYDFDAVCHLAAYAGLRHSMESPHIYHHNNVGGTLNILEMIRKFRVGKFVFVSTSSIYGDSKLMPYKESDPHGNLLSPYAATKRMNELSCFDYNQGYKIPMVLLRFFTVYGPWMRPDLAFYKFANLMTAGKQIDIYNFGKMQRDFTYIDDVVAAIVSALDLEADLEIINIGNDDPEMLDDVIFKLEQNLGVKALKNYLPMQPGEMPSTHADISRARELLKFDPKINIDDGLKKFVEWYKEYHNFN